MLVIISDLHLTDSTTGMRMPASAFRVFRERLEAMAYEASFRTGGVYKPIESIDLLLLGDIFDLIRTTRWSDEAKGQPGYTRPWEDPDDPAFVAKVEQITDGILQQNAETAEVFRSLADASGISLPPATSAGEVDRRVSRDHRSSSRLPVSVNTYYLLGNHDWIYHLGGDGFDRVRRRLKEAFSLANPAALFSHDPSESAAVMRTLERHRVFGRHGDIYDPFNYIEEKGRDYASLGDALVVDLFNLFPPQVRQEFQGVLPEAFFADLNEMGSVRPSAMTPVWIAGLLERHAVSPAHRQRIEEIWDGLVDHFLDLDFLKELDRPFSFDLVDKVQIVLRVLKGLSFESLERWSHTIDKVMDFVKSISGGSELGHERRAAEEQPYLDREARFIVYGHTHGYKVYPLRSTIKGGKHFDQMYINSGTWHPLHELGQADRHSKGFIFYKTMTYLGFYAGDERKGRAFETWSGTLDI